MRRIDLGFLLLAAACLVTGTVIGLAMGIAHEFQFAPVHAHLNLLGWTSLALFGFAYKLYPMLAQSPLATAHFLASGVSAVLFPIGVYASIAYHNPGLAILMAFVWLLGAVLFLANLVRVFLLAREGRGAPVRDVPTSPWPA